MWHDVANTQGVAPKLKRLRSDLFNHRVYDMLLAGHRAGKITPFDDDFQQKMRATQVQTMPAATVIYDFQPNPKSAASGHCFERSFLMFQCSNDAVWCHGDNQCLNLEHGKKNGGHAWIEIDNHVYDPTTLWKYPKDLYYKMLKVSNVEKMTHEEIYQLVINRNRDFQDFLELVDEYLKSVQNSIQRQNNQAVSLEK